MLIPSGRAVNVCNLPPMSVLIVFIIEFRSSWTLL